MKNSTRSPNAPETGRAHSAPEAEGPQRPDRPITLAHAVAAREAGTVLVERIESGEFEAPLPENESPAIRFFGRAFMSRPTPTEGWGAT